jgi:Phospholipase_D-nuclease N-terminal
MVLGGGGRLLNGKNGARYRADPGCQGRGVAMSSLCLLAQQPDEGGGLLGGALGLMCIVWMLVILASLFWLWMLIDALTNEPTTNDKILWFLVIFFLHLLGAVIYYFVRKQGRTRGGV